MFLISLVKKKSFIHVSVLCVVCMRVCALCACMCTVCVYVHVRMNVHIT